MNDQTKPRSIKVSTEDEAQVVAAHKAGTTVAIVAFVIIAVILFGVVYWFTR